MNVDRKATRGAAGHLICCKEKIRLKVWQWPDAKREGRWYLKAAEAGYPYAQYNLGLMYFNGDGVTKDWQKGAAWVYKAAEQGLVEAQVEMGLIYELLKDGEKAKEWYSRAAEQGHERAKQSLLRLS